MTAWWLALGAVEAAVLAAAAARWIARHPLTVSWDEAHYVEQVHRDEQRLRERGWLSYLRSLASVDRQRPPAYRLLALLMIVAGGVTARRARATTLAAWLLMLVFLLLAVGRTSGWAAGGFAVALLAACPIVLGACMRFYADGPLYAAIAATGLFLSEVVRVPDAPAWAVGGLAAALAAGALAKTSFAFVAGPMLAVGLAASLSGRLTPAGAEGLLVAGGIAALVVLPWWLPNARAALAYGRYAGAFDRHVAGGPAATSRVAAWCRLAVRSAAGPAVTVVVAGVVVAFLLEWLVDGNPTTGPQEAIVLAGAAGSVVLPVSSLRSTNHNPRLIGPALVPLALAVGVLAGALPLASSVWATAAASVLLAGQAAVILRSGQRDPAYRSGNPTARGELWPAPGAALLPVEQWDWADLRRLCLDLELVTPSIAYMGNSETMSPPQLRFPWVQAGESADVEWLWRYEAGDVDWDDVVRRAAAKSVVVTVPGYVGNVPDMHHLDNRHNDELVSRLRSTPQFREVGTLELGRFERTRAVVFVREDGQRG